MKSPGFPEPESDGRFFYFDIWEIAQWKYRFDRPESDPSEFDGDSPALERKRTLDGDIAEMKRDLMRGQLIEVNKINQLHDQLAASNRGYLEWLERHQHKAPADRYLDLLNDQRELVDRFCDSISSSTIDSEDSYGSPEEIVP